MSMVLGGAEPGLLGDVGFPGARGRQGGQHCLKNSCSQAQCLSLFSSWKNWSSR